MDVYRHMILVNKPFLSKYYCLYLLMYFDHYTIGLEFESWILKRWGEEDYRNLLLARL